MRRERLGCVSARGLRSTGAPTAHRTTYRWAQWSHAAYERPCDQWPLVGGWSH